MLKVTALVCLLWTAQAFVVPHRLFKCASCTSNVLMTHGSHAESFVDRGVFIQRVAAGLGAAVITLPNNVFAADIGSTQSPIAVVGARGKTGQLVVQGLLRRGKAVRAVTRDGLLKISGTDGLPGTLETETGDVTKMDTLRTAFEGCGAVIFCASASKKGGTAEKVDFEGVVNTAKACVGLKVPRLIVISSGAVTKPDSIGYKVTNIFGNIMTYKREGEVALEQVYAGAPKGIAFTIIRPGGLTDGPAKGVKEMELNQGDTIGGTISRADLAEVAVEAALSEAAEDTAFEVFDGSTRGPLQKNFPVVSGYEHKADNYPGLFDGLKTDIGL